MLMDMVYDARAKVEEYVPMVAKLPRPLQMIYGGESKVERILPPGTQGHSQPAGVYPRVKTL